ncbi:hypothetical protein J5N97_023536 [Dioscorea zingiberensis]|uniref:Uncharacterized protein n=1 Tax=Dioscorea zingiberensis TaxID=325984 RepID=A0A9D5H7Y3_9LILI|nr:hypothetical protein J5N97_023536 [Dioscorea zingiberensis]
MATLRILDQCSVSPPKGSVPETAIPLTFFDILWLLGQTVDRLFFYEFHLSTSHFIHHLLPTFKSSLSLALKHFFPLSGHVRPSSSSPDHYEIYYTDGDSVLLTITESEADFEELSGDQPRSIESLQALIPSLTISNGATPLMALQVTVFPYHGICLSISISHIAGDGTSTMNFIKSWASTCFSEATSTVLATPPLFNRSLITDPNNLHAVNLQLIKTFAGLSEKMSSNFESPNDVVFFSTFTLKKDHIEKLKSMVMAKYEKGDRVPFHCSTFVVGCGYVWACLVRSRGWPEERTAYMGFAVDARARLTPEIPAGYFGNCLSFCLAELKVGDIVDEDGVVKAIEALGKAIDGMREDGVLKGAEELPKLFVKLADERPLSIAGSPRFRVYDTDFGWGKPVKVEVTSIKETGAMSIAESGKEPGGLEFGLAFPKHEIDAFQACFTAGLQIKIP